MRATGINDKGQIIALDSNGYAELLTSIPTIVPTPAALWLFGSALAGFIGLKRRKVA